jgi:hypothetical protein
MQTSFDSLRRGVVEALPPLSCLQRGGKPIASVTSANNNRTSSGTANNSPTTRSPVTKPGMGAARRSTPPQVPVERAYLRGGAREAVSTVPPSRTISTLDRIRSGGRSSSGSISRSSSSIRGVLGSSSSSTTSGRGTLTTPTRVSRAHTPTRQHAPGPAPPSNPPVSVTQSGGASSAGSSSSSSKAAAAEQSSSSSSNSSGEKCDKCDGKHPTDQCPWFKKPRDKHPDAKRASEKKMLGMQSGPVEVLRSSSARVVRQPGDGSCLYHSLSFGLKDGSSASSLRREIAEFISHNPGLVIADSPLKDWVLWDSGSTVGAYCRKMSQGGVWGGGIEMAAVSHMKGVNVYVYQASGGGYKRISSFEGPNADKSTRAVRVLYGGGVHYDALQVTG